MSDQSGYIHPTPDLQFQKAGAPFHDVNQQSHTDRVRRELRRLGVSPFIMIRPEILQLPGLIQRDETLHGVAYGHDASGSVMLLATDQRLLRFTKQPLSSFEEDIDYASVTGISYYSGMISTVIVHTDICDYRVHTFNHASSREFIRYIEDRCLDTVLGPSKLWRSV